MDRAILFCEIGRRYLYFSVMGKKEKDIIASKNKKSSNASTPPGSLTKRAGSSALTPKKEPDMQKTEFYSKPIFKSKRFDLF